MRKYSLFINLPEVNTSKRFLNIILNGKIYEGTVEEALFNEKRFHTVRIVSYVSGYRYPLSILQKFKNSYLLLGMDEGVRKDILDTEITQELSSNNTLKQLIKENRLDIRFIGGNESLHSKIYIVEGDEINRVAIGSANFSETAFKGKQYEELFISDDEELYRIYRERFDYLWSISVPALPEENIRKKYLFIEVSENKPDGAESVTLAEDTLNLILDRLKKDYSIVINQNNFPVSQNEYIESIKADIQKRKEEIETELSRVELQEKIIENIKPKKNGSFELKNWQKVVEKIETIIAYKNKTVQETLPDRQLFIWNKNILYRKKSDGNLIPLTLKKEEIDRDRTNLMLEKIENFLRFYTIFATNKNDIKQSKKGFEVILYSFSVPFIWKIRKQIKENISEEKVARIPAFLFVGGHADSGKTKLLDFVSKLTNTNLYIYKAHIETKGEKVLEGLYAENNVAPLIVDEIEIKFWRSSSSEALIKAVANTRTEPHTCMIGATNSLREDAQVKPEIIKRSYFINFSNPMPKGRDFEKQAIEYYQNKVGDIDNYLMRVFVTLFSEKYPDIPEELLINLVSDPLYLSRKILEEIYYIASRPLPEIFPDKGFYDDFFEPENWRTLYKINRDLFLEYTEGNQTFFVVDINKLNPDPTTQKVLISKLPNNVVKSSTGRLILHKQEFLTFIGEKEENFIKKVFKGVFKKS